MLTGGRMVRGVRYGVILAMVMGCLLLSQGCQSASSQAWEQAKGDFTSLPGDMWDDSKAMVTDPFSLVVLGVGGGGSAYVRHDLDDDIADEMVGHHAFPRDFTIGAGAAGSPITHFALAGGGYVAGLLTEDDEMRGVSRTLIEALALNGLLTTGLKLIALDDSPNGEHLAWPSGHTSSTVTLATVLNEYYGPWVGVPLYALSGLVMYERVESGEHWASDVVFGAALGYVVGRMVAREHEAEIFGMQVVPFTNPESGATGIGLFCRF